MKKITVCIGSSCHLKGSRQVVEGFKKLIAEKNIEAEVEFSGTFCMGKCNGDGVSVTVDGEYYAVKPENIENFFNEVIAANL